MRRPNKACIDLIKHFEGFSAKPYPDPGTGAKPYTIGYGTTVYPDGKSVTLKDPDITEKQGEAYLLYEVNEKAKAVESLIKVKINDNQFDALVSFAYNVGTGALGKSTLLKLINSKADNLEIADEFLRWNKAGGKEMAGLTKRRQAERSLFLQPEDSELSEKSMSDEEINEKLKSIEEDILK